MSDLRKHAEKSTVVDVDHCDEASTETGLCAEGEWFLHFCIILSLLLVVAIVSPLINY